MRKRTMLGLVFFISILAILPFATAKVNPLFSGAWTGQYSGFNQTQYGNWTTSYVPINGTIVHMNAIFFNATQLFMEGSSIEDQTSREVIMSYMAGLGAGDHMVRGTPSELTSGIGATFSAVIFSLGDAIHTVVGETTVTVSGVTLNCWIANGTDGALVNQTLWLEKTTGMLVRISDWDAPTGQPYMDLLLWSATNIEAIAGTGDDDPGGIAGYDVWILLSLLGVIPIVWWRRKGRSH